MGKFKVNNEKEAELVKRMENLGIRESDLDEHFIRGSGPGGQKINKTSSCVYIKHLPTGKEVKCQAGRSQALNRFLARRELCEILEQEILGKKSEAQQAKEKIRRQKRRKSRRQRDKMVKDKFARATIKGGRKRVSSSDE
jgi:protein subunit release factor B